MSDTGPIMVSCAGGEVHSQVELILNGDWSRGRVLLTDQEAVSLSSTVLHALEIAKRFRPAPAVRHDETGSAP